MWSRTAVTCSFRDGVYLSSAYADKYELGAEDTITLGEKYEDTTYTFTVDGVYDYMGALAVFMPREKAERSVRPGRRLLRRLFLRRTAD